jgi:hypothetical protein
MSSPADIGRDSRLAVYQKPNVELTGLASTLDSQPVVQR